MPRLMAKAVLFTTLLIAATGCGLDTSASFNADGSVTVGLRFMIPKSLLDSGSGVTVTGLSPSDISSAQSKLQKLYPGSKVVRVTEGDETGALATIPFKTEKDAFAFLTQPSKLSPSSAASGSGMGMNLSDTGGLFKTATHTTSGGTDTYRFTTVPPPQPSPSPGSQSIPGADAALLSVFVITFAITVPHVITSAPGAVFTLDRKTAIWKLSLTSPQTLTANTGPDTGPVAAVTPLQDWRLLIAVGFIAIAIGFLLGMFLTWRGLLRPAQHLVAAPAAVPTATPAPPQPDQAVAWPGPPSEAPPPTKLT
jgi:hypothetical protein